MVQMTAAERWQRMAKRTDHEDVVGGTKKNSRA
jgi:hypothetical protein